LTEQNIAKLFLAAFIPAGLAVIGFFIAIRAYIYVYPDAGPATPSCRPSNARGAWAKPGPCSPFFSSSSSA
jgi:TRAP-type C4-dicarboxylate transport system permease large subunit